MNKEEFLEVDTFTNLAILNYYYFKYIIKYKYEFEIMICFVLHQIFIKKFISKILFYPLCFFAFFGNCTIK